MAPTKKEPTKTVRKTQKAKTTTPALKTKGAKMLTLSLENLAFLKTIQGQSLFVDTLLDRCRTQETLSGSQRTAELVDRYYALTGVLPEKAYQKFLQKRIALLEKNRTQMKSPSLAGSHLSGSAFLKLDQALEHLQAENATKDLKQAVTYGVMFRMTGCNQQTIRNWFQARKQDIAAYHKSLGVEDPGIHNRQVAVVERVRRAQALRESRTSQEDNSQGETVSCQKLPLSPL
ncbi:hypothetical protein Bealeia1_02042 (plasmid) [Candidatus Bealeia paramacronuclearis]|uniref:DUF1845 domain-containing protein n=1 Tax=Candidatus Bealeia paramacronuclearis TaxID=1921001 RepID=A0ABZ2C697_9PROT|nr:hypothetical protein [Candidatus Bealeia paramacronuclearis]